jgi:YgiT-type zinc finger domain-containing protein
MMTTVHLCPICHTGRLQKRAMVYLEWYGQDLLIVDRMPALVCDVCSERVYDYDAMENLRRLLWAPPPGASSLGRNSPPA